jgi:hypothetical protein
MGSRIVKKGALAGRVRTRLKGLADRLRRSAVQPGVTEPDLKELLMIEPSDRPTVRQLRCLRALALSTGTTFATPTTKAQASREIDRIKRRQPLTTKEKRVEGDRLHTDRDRPLAASTVKAQEITGYGSTAKWANTRPVKERDPFLV